ncbi:hypothetical protein [Emticicia sp. 17c]|uniref:hypothetical protein n=1 Tax=Emticicia sp. 17c TaxID=3127704 RepID=UPI00301C117D
MFQNVAFDVVIGLVFIYLLYSLYATVILELIASILGLRARNLSYALNRMLSDEKQYSNKIKSFFARLFTSFVRVTGKAINQKDSPLFKAFFNQPLIKFLSSGGLGNTPSFISPENFTKALLDSFKADNPNAGPLAAIKQGLETSPLFTENSETKKLIESLLDDANNDVEKFKKSLESWFLNTMQRASGWYKQTSQAFLILIGLALAVTFKIDTLSIIKKLSNDEAARNRLVTMAVEFSEKNPTLPTANAKDKTAKPQDNNKKPDASASATAKANKKSPPDDAKANNITPPDTTKDAAQQQLDMVLDLKKTLEADIKESESILTSWGLPEFLKYDSNTAIPKGFVRMPYGTSKFLLVPEHLDIPVLKEALPPAESCNPKEGFVTLSAFKYKWHYFWAHLGGFVLTILALSLGAPFWFDTLNRLIKLKTSEGNTNNGGK